MRPVRVYLNKPKSHLDLKIGDYARVMLAARDDREQDVLQVGKVYRVKYINDIGKKAYSYVALEFELTPDSRRQWWIESNHLRHEP